MAYDNNTVHTRRLVVLKTRIPAYARQRVRDVHFPNIAKKLRLLPILCTFSALLSIELFSVGMAGIGGLFNGGVTGIPLFAWGLTSRNGSSFGFAVLRLRLLMVPSREFSFPFSSLDVLLRPSISPSTVVPLVARYSSAIPTKRITPRLGETPMASLIKDWMRAALRLLVVGWIWDGRAVNVRI